MKAADRRVVERIQCQQPLRPFAAQRGVAQGEQVLVRYALPACVQTRPFGL